MEAAGETAEQRGQHVQAEAAEQDRPPAEAVRHQSPEQLAAAHARHVRSDDPLHVVLVRDRKRMPDDGEGRQHGVDGDGLRRHHRRRQYHEFGEADLRQQG
jgi:hypothetical protein